MFTGESMMCAEALHLRYVLRLNVEELSEEYYPKKTMYNDGKKCLHISSNIVRWTRAVYISEKTLKISTSMKIFLMSAYYKSENSRLES